MFGKMAQELDLVAGDIFDGLDSLAGLDLQGSVDIMKGNLWFR